MGTGDKGPRGDRGDCGNGRRAAPTRARAPAARARAQRVVTESARLTTLDSGVRVVTEAMPSVRSIALGFWIRAGLRDEGEQAGISHFLSTFFRGRIASARSRSTSCSTRWRRRGQRRHRQGDDLRLPRFLDMHLERASTCSRTWCAAVLPGHRLRAPGGDRGDRHVRGRALRQGARRARRGDLRRPPAGAAGDRPRRGDLIGAGAADRQVARRALRAQQHGRGGGRQPRSRPIVALVDARSATPRPRRSPIRRRPTPRRRCASTPRRQSSITWRWRRSDRSSGRAALRDADPDTILGGFHPRDCSRRCARSGLAYSVYSYTSQYADTGQVAVYVGTRPDNVQEAMTVIGTELNRLQSDGVTAAELDRARENVKGAPCCRWSRARRA